MKKVNPIISGIRCILALTCVGALAGGLWIGLTEHEFAGTYFVTALTSCMALLITHAPDFVTHKDILMIPAAIQVGFSIFTFCAMFLGEIMNFYDRISWWDNMLHFTSGIMFSLVGLLLFTSLNRKKEVRSQLNPIGMVLFAVCFSITCGTVWEIFEFVGDTLLGMNMQRWQTGISQNDWSALQNVSNLSNPGLVDTMKDIIADTFGSVLSVAFILPLAKCSCSYQKTSIPTNKLLEEWKDAYAVLQMKWPPGKTLAHELTAIVGKKATLQRCSEPLQDASKAKEDRYNAA